MLIRLSPRLRFIDGDDVAGGLAEVVDTSESTTEVESTNEAPKGNPAWESLRTQLDPISFSRIEPELRKMDQSAKQRIEAQNEQFKPWKDLSAQGVTPERVQQALSLSERLDANPAEIHQYLGDFLAKTGRMPTPTEVKAADDAGEIGDDDSNEDPRIAQQGEQLARMQEFLEEQQYQQELHAATVELDNETSSLKAAHPELSDEDVTEIIRQAAFIAQTNAQQGKKEIPSLEEVHTSWFSAFRNRILSTPRPGDSAPRLLPTSGGLPSAAQQKSLGQMSRQEMQDFVAQSLSANKGQ